MNFNPTKSNQEPDMSEYTLPPIEEDLINYTTIPVAENLPPPMAFEGTSVSDWQQVGMETVSLLKVASNTVADKQKFNIPLLQKIPLKEVLLHFGAKETESHVFNVLGCVIKTQENSNKWFNTSPGRRTGNVNAINLAKHLIALKENLNEIENATSLFKAAGKELTILHNNLTNRKEVVNTVVPDTVTTPAVVAEVVEKTAAVDYEAKKKQWALEKERKKQVTKELNEIPLDVVLEYIGANNNEDGVSGKWKIHDTGHNVNVTGQMWKNWNTQKGGYGGISLLADIIENRDNLNIVTKEDNNALFFKARELLLIEFGQDIEEESFKNTEFKVKLKEPFYMPHVIDFKINAVRNYLHQERGIPMWVLNKQINEGLLFAGAPSDWKKIEFLHDPEKLSNDNVWAVFLSVNGEAAEMRGIQRKDELAKIKPKGSVTSSGGFLIKAEQDCMERTVVSCEASVDACSYHAIYPGRVVASCMGVNFNLAVDNALEALAYPSSKYHFAFDNDLAGNEAAVRFKDCMIEELGEEEYKDLVGQGRIKYFDLGIRCLQECIKENKVFYFDVSNNAIGKEAATMFQNQLSQVIPMPEIRQLIKDGKLKYANICPVWETVKDPLYEAKQAVTLLSSEKPYYLRLKSIEPDKQNSAKLLEARALFEAEFERLAGDKLLQWTQEGKIIHKKEAVAKDWNEYFLHIRDTPEMKEKLAYQEKHYGEVYSNIFTKKTTKKRM